MADFVAAANGDSAACLRLSRISRASVLYGSDDVLFASMEGAMLARLAAVRGDRQAAILLGEHLVAISAVYAAGGDDETACNIGAEAMAILELCEGHPPEGWDRAAWSDHVLQVVTAAAELADGPMMHAATQYRAVWAPFLSAPAEPIGGI